METVMPSKEVTLNILTISDGRVYLEIMPFSLQPDPMKKIHPLALQNCIIAEL